MLIWMLYIWLPFKGSLQWKNDLGSYISLVLVMKIGMCDLVIFCYYRVLTHAVPTSHDVTLGIRTHMFVWKCMEIRVLLGLSATKKLVGAPLYF